MVRTCRGCNCKHMMLENYIAKAFWVDNEESHTGSYSVPHGDLCHAHPSCCKMHKVFPHAEISLARGYFCAISEFENIPLKNLRSLLRLSVSLYGTLVLSLNIVNMSANT